MTSREIVPADLLAKMTVAATLGNDKASLGVELTPYQSVFFDDLVVEVRAMQAEGMVVMVPREMPDIEFTVHMLPKQ